MCRRSCAVLAVVLFLLTLADYVSPRESSRRTGAPADRPIVASREAPRAAFSSASTDTFLLGSWTFDAPGGGPDPQGWTTHDATAQLDTFFHVDDFAGLSGYFTPLEGSQSLWCGTRPRPDMCACLNLPAYGDYWEQYVESIPFNVTGDVSVTFLASWDSEAGYDQTRVQYLSGTGSWQTLATMDGKNQALMDLSIPADSLAGTATLRFWFSSDNGWSPCDGLVDADGAIIIDSLTVSDQTGVIDYQDFESEAPGAFATSDGHWQCLPRTPFGDYAALFDGSTVLQEDTLVTDTTYLWGFFNGSTAEYQCGAHPEQPALPFTKVPGSTDYLDYLHNEVWSPWIPWNTDVNGHPVAWDAQALLLKFDVYRDLPLDDALYYTFRVRFLVNGCPTTWWKLDEFYYGAGKDWYHAVENMSLYIVNGATDVQFAVSAADWCAYYCGTVSGNCHTHAPLFDNASVERVLTYTTAAGNTPNSPWLEQNVPNPFNPETTIRYAITAPGRVRLRVYDVGGRLVRTLVDASQVPRADGYAATWDGRDERGKDVATGVYFYRLQAPGFTQTRKMVLLK